MRQVSGTGRCGESPGRRGIDVSGSNAVSLPVVVTAALVVALCAAPLAALELRLDEDVATSLGRVPATSVATPTASELRRRVLKARDRAATLEREAGERAARLAASERTMEDLQRLSKAQDRAIDALRAALRGAAAPRPPEPVATPPSTVREVRADPARAMTPRPVANGTLADEHNWLEGALALAITLLLGWALHLRARALAGDRVVEEEEEHRRLAVAR